MATGYLLFWSVGTTAPSSVYNLLGTSAYAAIGVFFSLYALVGVFADGLIVGLFYLVKAAAAFGCAFYAMQIRRGKQRGPGEAKKVML